MRASRTKFVPQNKVEQPCRQRHNERCRRSERRITQLRRLPTALFVGCVRRFRLGDTAKAVAVWLFSQPDKGGCQHLSFETLRLYLQPLRRRVLASDPVKLAERRSVLHKIAKTLVEDQMSEENDREIHLVGSNTSAPGDQPAAPAPVNVPKAVREADARVEESFRNATGREVQIYVLESIRQNLPKQLGVENAFGLAMDPVSRRLRELRQLGADMRKAELAELKLKKTVTSEDDPNFDAIPVPEKLMPEQKEFAKAVDNLSPGDYDKALTLTKMLQEMADLEREAAKIIGQEQAEREKAKQEKHES